MADAGERILVAFDGSPAALAAARLAFDLAAQTGGTVRLVSVLTGDKTGRLIDRLGRVDHSAGKRREADLRSAVDHSLRIGQSRAVDVESVIRTAGTTGEAFGEILAEASEWGAAWIFMGQTSTRGPGRALLGSQTGHVLEFSTVPVVVVPAARVDRPREPETS
jgi:nucleotide-binding universal stress UspA family protein